MKVTLIQIVKKEVRKLYSNKSKTGHYLNWIHDVVEHGHLFGTTKRMNSAVIHRNKYLSITIDFIFDKVDHIKFEDIDIRLVG